jgi:hypothetical protein
MTRVIPFLSVLILTASVDAVFARQPDPRQMSGIPLPVGDMPAGTVTVRVIRGALSNPIAGHDVELHGSTTTLTGKTNEAGRAEFKSVPIGARLKAVTTVSGERLESQEFTVPPNAGIRMMLVAVDPAIESGRSSAAPAQPGTVTLGPESRFVFEMGDDGLSVFNIFQVLNTSTAPVQVPQPLVFELPESAKGASILDGSSPQATAAGKRVTVAGPFAPGPTLVQFVYTLPYAGSDLTVRQQLPVALSQLSVAAQKVGEMQLASPQIAQHRNINSQGLTYIVGQGPAIEAGQAVTFNFTGLPRVPVWPRNLALALAVAILAGGAWASARAESPAKTARRRKLEAQRDRQFGELATLEQLHRERAIDPERYAARRRELVSGLERIYAELDEEGVAVGRAS